MRTYRRKPIEVNAIQYTGDFENFCKINGYFVGNAFETVEDNESYLIIHTVDGDIRAKIGDYIVKDSIGRFFVYDSDYFEKNYELSN